MGCYRGKAAPDHHTKLRLFAESAGFCQSPKCHCNLFIDDDSGNFHIAEMAHLFAANNKGPRSKPELSAEERGAFENLILLCPTCHSKIDKAPESAPDALLVEWKRSHFERIAAAFGAVKYDSRQKARAAIQSALAENREIFHEYGPDNEYKFNPESEVAQVWQRKVRSRILPNNRKVLTILDANQGLLNDQELTTLEQFRQHIDDLEARHLAEGVSTVARRFPTGMESILTGNCNA
jgi:hypothetical protein